MNDVCGERCVISSVSGLWDQLVMSFVIASESVPSLQCFIVQVAHVCINHHKQCESNHTNKQKLGKQRICDVLKHLSQPFVVLW